MSILPGGNIHPGLYKEYLSLWLCIKCTEVVCYGIFRVPDPFAFQTGVLAGHTVICFWLVFAGFLPVHLPEQNLC